MSETVELRFKYTEDEYASAMRRYFARALYTKTDIVAGIAAVIVGVLFLIYSGSSFVWYFLIFAGAGLLLINFVAYFVAPRLRFRREPAVKGRNLKLATVQMPPCEKLAGAFGKKYFADAYFSMFIIFSALTVLVGAIIFVAFIRTRQSVAVWQSVLSSLDKSSRNVGILAAAPGVILIGWLIYRRVNLPLSLILGFVFGFGAFVFLLGAFGMEGMLLEKQSQARLRSETNLPAPSSKRGRVVAVVVGLTMMAFAAWLIVRIA